MENIEFTQERQLPTVVQHLMESDQIKILERNVRARFERRKHRLEKLIELYSLIHNYGNNYSDLLCMLMGIQYRCLTEIAEFYADARHYFDKEYSLSSMRCVSDSYTIHIDILTSLTYSFNFRKAWRNYKTITINSQHRSQHVIRLTNYSYLWFSPTKRHENHSNPH